MKIRVEFGPSKSTSYAWAVRLAKQIPTHKETIEEGITIHSVEFHDIETFYTFERCVGHWKNHAWFLNGKPVPSDVLWKIFLKKYPPEGATPLEMRLGGHNGPLYYLDPDKVIDVPG